MQLKNVSGTLAAAIKPEDMNGNQRDVNKFCESKTRCEGRKRSKK